MALKNIELVYLNALAKAIISNQTRSRAPKYWRWRHELLILDMSDEMDETLGEQIPSSELLQSFLNHTMTTSWLCWNKQDPIYDQ